MSNQTNGIDNPHDKQFFSALRNVEVAREAISACLPTELVLNMDLQNIRFYKTKLVSPQMKEFEADIFYEVPFRNSKALLMFHCVKAKRKVNKRAGSEQKLKLREIYYKSMFLMT